MHSRCGHRPLPAALTVVFSASSSAIHRSCGQFSFVDGDLMLSQHAVHAGTAFLDAGRHGPAGRSRAASALLLCLDIEQPRGHGLVIVVVIIEPVRRRGCGSCELVRLHVVLHQIDHQGQQPVPIPAQVEGIGIAAGVDVLLVGTQVG